MAETSVSNVKNFSGESGRRRSSASRALVGDIVQFVDFICVIAASVAVAVIYHIFALQSEFDYQPYTAAGIIGATGLTALLRRDGFYEFDQLLSSSGNIRAVVSTWGLVILGLLAFGFALKISDAFSRVWLVAWSVTAVVVIALARIIAARLLRSMISDGGVFSRRIAIVGATKLGA
ncbi:hypothetical protein MNBD_ALPHA05-2234, partial [hydrothermal vent metagenome]